MVSAMPGWHLRGAGVQLSGPWDLGAGAAGYNGQGSCAPQTHLAEAAKVGQRRFVERKVSHCRTGERCKPRAAPIVLCGRSGVWSSVALVRYGLPPPLLPAPSRSWLIDRSSTSASPLSLPPRLARAWFLASFPWDPNLWPCYTMDRLVFWQMPRQGVHHVA